MRGRLRLVFLVSGLGFLIATCVRALVRDGSALPSGPSLGLALPVSAIGLLLAAAAWAALAAERASRGALTAGFIAAQVGKYIPGGVWVGVGQVGFGIGAGLTAGEATGTLGVYGLCLVAAAGMVASAATIVSAGPGVWLAVAVTTLPLLLLRPCLVRVSAAGNRLLPARLGAITVPAQARILSCFAGLVPALLCSALAYAVLLRGAGLELSLLSVVAGFTVAWLAGFLAVGLPSGIGAREATLVLLLGADPVAIVATSVAHRLVQALIEVLLLIAVRRRIPGGDRALATPTPSIRRLR